MQFERKFSGWNIQGHWPRTVAVFTGALLLVVLFCGAVALQRVSPGASSSQALNSDRIYNLTNVWAIHLKFAPDQWDAMEPKGGGNPFSGGAPGGRPGAGRGPNGDRTLAPVFMSQGDLNRDGRISQQEFARLAETWFKTWDAERMFKVEAFKKLYVARLDEFSKTIFRPERIAQQVDQIAAVIRPAVQEESEAKLDRFDKLVAGELLSAPGPFGGGQTKPIKPFTKVRTASVLEQLAGKSQGLVTGSGFPGGFGGAGGLGLGMFGRPLFQVLGKNKDSSVTWAEFTEGFSALFKEWNTDTSGYVTLAQLRSGIQKDLPPPSQGFPGGGPRTGQGFRPNGPSQQ